MEIIQNTDLTDREITLKMDGPSGLAVRGKKYGSNWFYAVELFMDEEFKQRITLGTYGVNNGNVTEKYVIPNIAINGKPFNPKTYLEKNVDLTVVKKKTSFKVRAPTKHKKTTQEDEEEEEEEKPKKKMRLPPRNEEGEEDLY